MTCSRFQIAVMGSGRVGKSSILQRYVFGTFDREYRETVEEVYSHDYNSNRRHQNIDFIDTAGSIAFPAMRQIYISNAKGFVLVYSISSKHSFDAMKKLWEQIKKARNNILNIPVVIIGNNLDEENIRQIETFDALDWACSENLGGCFLEVSAKEDKYVHDIFKILFEQMGTRRCEQKGPMRLRSTSICKMQSESETKAQKKKYITKSLKNFSRQVGDKLNNSKTEKTSRVKSAFKRGKPICTSMSAHNFNVHSTGMYNRDNSKCEEHPCQSNLAKMTNSDAKKRNVNILPLQRSETFSGYNVNSCSGRLKSSRRTIECSIS